MDKLFSMEVFVAAVELGSLTAAARRFDISAPMVGKHVHFLENKLGARLLTRTTRRQSLTEIGRAYYEDCKRILAAVRAAETGAQAMRAGPRGKLRISAPVSYGSLSLAPVIADYLAVYREVSVELELDDRIVDVVREGYDLAVRIGHLPDSTLVARSLAPYRMIICAAPSCLASRGTPLTPDDLSAHECLGFSFWNKRMGWALDRDVATQGTLPVSRLQANNGQALRMAALQGFGIVLQPRILLSADLATGRLVEILHEYAPKPRPMHVVYPHTPLPVPKLATFVAFATERLGA